MNCDRIEKLLPRYHEGDLSDTERSMAAAHIASCARCREASAVFAELERALTARRDELPRSGEIAEAVIARLALPRRHRPRLSRWILRMVPGLLALAAVLPPLAQGGSFSGITGKLATGYSAFVAFLTAIPDLIAGTAGGEWWVLLAVYLVIAVSFSVAGSMISRKIVQG